MLEILVYLYESYRMAELAPDRDTLERKLFAAGFDGPSVKDALDWFNHMATTETHPRLAESAHFRHYAREELDKLDGDCRASLRFLEEARILDAESREWVINGLMHLSGEDIGPEQVRWMSLVVLWSRGHIEHFTFLEEMLLNETTLH
jgi:Smg protein